MRETIFMYTLGCILAVGMLIAFLLKKQWIRYHKSQFELFKKAELSTSVKKTIYFILQNKWIIVLPIAVALIHSLPGLLYMVVMSEGGIPLIAPENDPFPGFLQPQLTVKEVLSIITSSPLSFFSSIYHIYNSGIVVIIATILFALLFKKSKVYLERFFINQDVHLVKLIKVVLVFSLIFVLGIILLFAIARDRVEHIELLSLSLLVIGSTPLVTLVGSGIQSCVINSAKMRFVNPDTDRKEIFLNALNHTSNLFYLNIILLLLSTSIPTQILGLTGFLEYPGDLRPLYNLIHYQEYVYIFICIITLLLPIILCDNVSFFKGLLRNFVFIYRHFLKYLTMVTLLYASIFIPSILKLAIGRTYHPMSIISYVSEFLFYSIQLVLSLLVFLSIVYTYGTLSKANIIADKKCLFD